MIEKKQVAVQTKTVSSTKLVSATALLIGVALGGYLLNMAGAAVRCTSDSCTVISRLNAVHKDLIKKIGMSEDKWVYVYGPDKNSSQDLNNLIGYVNQGKDVKVQVMPVFSECEAIYAQDKVTCEFTRLGDSTTDGTYTDNFYSVFAPNNTEPPTPVDTFVTKIKHEIGGGYTKNSFAANNGVRWFVRK